MLSAWSAEHMLDECLVAVYERVTTIQNHMGCKFIITGIPQALVNGVISCHLEAADCEEAVDDITRQLNLLDIPYSWWVNTPSAPPNLASSLLERGLTVASILPGMSIDLASPVKHSLPEGLSIQRVTNVELLREWSKTICSVYEMPNIAEDITRLYLRDHFSDRLVHLIGHYQGYAAVAGTIVFRPEGFYIFNVATLPAFQRLGLARALYKQMLAKAWDKGYRRGVLQTTDVGASFSSTLGFQSLTNYQVYVKHR